MQGYERRLREGILRNRLKRVVVNRAPTVLAVPVPAPAQVVRVESPAVREIGANTVVLKTDKVIIENLNLQLDMKPVLNARFEPRFEPRFEVSPVVNIPPIELPAIPVQITHVPIPLNPTPVTIDVSPTPINNVVEQRLVGTRFVRDEQGELKESQQYWQGE